MQKSRGTYHPPPPLASGNFRENTNMAFGAGV